MRNRCYNPYYGRFYSEDPVWSTNLFPYADNNPINRIDPNGLYSVTDEVGFGESLIPVWGSWRSGMYNATQGNYLWAGFYAGLAVSEVLTFGVASEAKIAYKTSTVGVQLNKKLGDSFRDEVAEYFIKNGYDVQKEVYKKTPFGGRRVDLEIKKNGKLLGGLETKLGNSSYKPSQRAKDMWLKNFYKYRINLIRRK